jgi:hypothetical protein
LEGSGFDEVHGYLLESANPELLYLKENE